MSQLVFAGASLTCSLGGSPQMPLIKTSGIVGMNGTPAATVKDNQPRLNIPSFGICKRLPIPPPCVPDTSSADWLPGSTTLAIEGEKALNVSCKLMCKQGGIITILTPGQSGVNAP